MADSSNPYGISEDTPSYTTQPIRQIQSPVAAEQYPPQQQPAQAPAPGLFDSVPFHSWLAKNAKEKYGADPWDLSEDQINKSVNDYAEGPLRTIIAHQHANGKYTGSDAALKDKIDNDVNYYKMLAQQEVEGNIPQIRGHFQSLKPPPTVAQTNAPEAPTQQTPFSSTTALGNIGNALVAAPARLAGFVAQGAAGIPKAIASNPLTAMNPEAQKAIENSDAAQKWQDYFFGLSDKANKAAEGIEGKPGDSLASKAAFTLGKLPEGITTFGMGQSIENARKAIQQGQDLDKVKKNLAIDAATNIVAGRLPGGSALARAAKGALYNPLLQNASALLKGEDVPNATDNILSALFGAGFAAALGRRPTPPKTPEVTNATQTNNAPTTEAENLAKSVSGGSEGSATPETNATPATPKPISPETQSILDKTDLEMAQTPGDKGQTPQERWNSKEVQDLYNGALKDVPVDERPAFTDAFKKQWADIHDVNPDEVVTTQAEPAAPADTSGEDALAAAAQENAVPTEGAGRNVEGLLAEPIQTQVRGSGGKVTNKSVPVEFQNPTDQLAYLYKHGDEETRPLIADELVKRGVPTERIQEYADKVDKNVSGSVNALKHKVTISDRGFTAKSEPVQLLRKPRSPKA